MQELIRSLCRDDIGAVTVDWVVLAAAVVGLGLSITALFISAVGGPEGAFETNMNTAQTTIGSLYN